MSLFPLTRTMMNEPMSAPPEEKTPPTSLLNCVGERNSMNEPEPAATAEKVEPKTTPRMARAELLAPDLSWKLLSHFDEWPGAIPENAEKHFPGKTGQVRGVLASLTDAGLLTSVPVLRTTNGRLAPWPHQKPTDAAEVESKEPESKSSPAGQDATPKRGGRLVNMTYITDEAATFFLNRDGVAVLGTRHRTDGAINQDHRLRRPHRNHTGQLDLVLTTLASLGFPVRSGRRNLMDFPGIGRVAPDAVMTAGVPLGLVCITDLSAPSSAEYRRMIPDALHGYLSRAAINFPDDLLQRHLIICPIVSDVRWSHEHLPLVGESAGVPIEVLALCGSDSRLRIFPRPLPEGHCRLGIPIDFCVEYERSARTPRRIRRKLRNWVLLAKRGYHFPLLFISETDKVEETVVREASSLMDEEQVSLILVTSTYEKVVHRLPAGENGVWSFQGRSIRLGGVGMPPGAGVQYCAGNEARYKGEAHLPLTALVNLPLPL